MLYEISNIRQTTTMFWKSHVHEQLFSTIPSDKMKALTGFGVPFINFE